MKGTMKTAVMLDIGKIGFEEREIPQVKDDEVLVAVTCTTMNRERSVILS